MDVDRKGLRGVANLIKHQFVDVVCAVSHGEEFGENTSVVLVGIIGAFHVGVKEVDVFRGKFSATYFRQEIHVNGVALPENGLQFNVIFEGECGEPVVRFETKHAGFGFFHFSNRAQLEEIAAENELDAAKGSGIVAQRLANFVENVENFTRHHRNLVDNENLGGSPGLGRGTVFENIADDFLGGTFGQFDAAPRMDRAGVGLEENRGATGEGAHLDLFIRRMCVLYHQFDEVGFPRSAGSRDKQVLAE